MGHLLEYSGIVTKTRAMESRLLSPGQFQELASLHTIPEAVEYLKKNTAYAETLESLEPTQLHRGNIEKLLTQSLYRDYTKLYRFCGQKQRKFMELRLKSYEIDLIDYCLRIVINHYKRPLIFIIKRSSLTVIPSFPSTGSSLPERQMNWWTISKGQNTMIR